MRLLSVRPMLMLGSAIALVSCSGDASQGSVITPAPSPTQSETPTPTPTPTQANGCVAGTWQAVATDPNDTLNARMPLQLETAHFAVHYLDGVATEDQARSATDQLEHVFDYFIGTIGFHEPDCERTAKRKVNVFVGADYGLSGGADSLGQLGMWIGPGGLGDKFGLAHEFTHSLQVGTGGLRDSPYTGWLYESHANWMATQLPEFRNDVHCSEMLVNFPHIYYGSTRDRYCNWQPLEYLKDRYGYAAVNAIWDQAPKQGTAGYQQADVFQVLMDSRGWDLEQLNDFFGEWAMHNVTWDYTNPDGSDQGAVYRSAYGSYAPATGQRSLRTTRLDPIDASQGRYAVPFAWAPQRWGYNLVRLHPDSGADTIHVMFRGVVQNAPATSSLPGLQNEPSAIPQPGSGWRWGVVTVAADGKPTYSTIQRGADGSLDIPVQQGAQSYWLVVLGAATVFHHIRWDQPYYSIYRYPWMVQFTGAKPDGFQAGAPDPTTNGHAHPNGGGWVAAGATVDASAYVGPYARVLGGSVTGNARVEDHAVVESGSLSGSAVINALTILWADTQLRDQARLGTVFMPIGAFERGITLSGTAQMYGDVEQRGVSTDHGVYYGFVDANSPNTPAAGSALTAPVQEVTAKPNYTWRP